MDYIYKKYYINNYYIQYFYNYYTTQCAIFIDNNCIFLEKIATKEPYEVKYKDLYLNFIKNKLYNYNTPIKEYKGSINNYVFKNKNTSFSIKLIEESKKIKIYINDEEYHEQVKLKNNSFEFKYNNQIITLRKEKLFDNYVYTVKFNVRDYTNSLEDNNFKTYINKFSIDLQTTKFKQYYKAKKLELLIFPFLLTLITLIELFGVFNLPLIKNGPMILLIACLLALFFLLTSLSLIVTFKKFKKKYKNQ